MKTSEWPVKGKTCLYFVLLWSVLFHLVCECPQVAAELAEKSAATLKCLQKTGKTREVVQDRRKLGSHVSVSAIG